MSEKRWKVIKNGGAFPPGAILTLRNEATVGYPYMQGKDGAASNIGIDRLVEIDADGNTIRTYAEGDTLDGGTLVQEEKKMEGLDGVSMDIAQACENISCIFCNLRGVGGTSSRCVEVLAAEVQRLRDKLAAVHDVWEKAGCTANRADVLYYDGDVFHYKSRFTRELPKTIDEELLDEFLPLDGDDKVMSPSTARYKARAMLAEYKVRTGQTS